MTRGRRAARFVLLLGVAHAPQAGPPLTAQERLESGIASAEAGALAAAIDAFTAARDLGEGELRDCAIFNRSRALWQRAGSRELPPEPPASGSVPPGELANVRARLASMRGDLEAARSGLVDLLLQAPDDVGACSAVAHVSAALGRVVALDQAWRARAEARREGVRGGSAPPNAPLREGPSSEAALGAESGRPGAAEPAADPNAAGPAGAGGPPQAAAPSEEEARELRDRLLGVRAEMRGHDEQRAAAAARSNRRR